MSTQTQTEHMNDGGESIPLDDAGEVRLPVVDVLTGRGFVTGKSGSGKSNTASVLAEELLDRGFPLLVVDTDGEYWGLKEEYELLHVGADEECDLQVGPEHAGKLAELALEQNVPIILDVSGYLDADEASALIRETASELFTREKKLNKPFLLLVEEIHEYIPEGGGLDETGEMLVRISKRGRKRGLGITGVSQRPQDVKKDFISQCDWLVWHRLTWDTETAVVRRVLDSDYADAVQDLEDGEAFVLADFIEDSPVRVQVRRKRTFDAGATPDLGEFEPPELKSVGGDLVDELEKISQREERRQDRVAQLEATLEEKDARIAELEEELENARDLQNMAQQFTEAMMAQGGEGDAPTEKVDELIQERNRLESELGNREEQINDLRERIAELEEAEHRLEQYETLNVEEAEEAVHRLQEALGVEADGEAEKWRRKYEQARERADKAEHREAPDPPDVVNHPAVKRQVQSLKNIVADQGEKQLQMLEWFQFYGPGKLGDAYFHAGYKRSSSRKHEVAKPLKEAGLIEKVGRGEYRYALDEKVREQFEDNPQIGEEDIKALIEDVESAFHDELAQLEDS